MPSVLQDWVADLPMMMQSVLLSAIRGPDGQPKYNGTKKLLRWLRRCILVSSFDKVVLTNPVDTRGGSFTGPSFEVSDVTHLWYLNASDKYKEKYKNFFEDPNEGFIAKGGEHKFYEENWFCFMEPVINGWFLIADALPIHFTLHFMHAAEIIGYFHPEPKVREWWNYMYQLMVEDMHLTVESREECIRRLSDDREEWLKKSNPATTA